MRRNKARCLIIHQDKILLCRCVDADQSIYYILPGGSIEKDENPEDTIKREILEELGSKLSELVFVKEIANDYIANEVNKEQTIFLFKGNLDNEEIYQKNDFKILDHDSILMQWIPIADVKQEKIILHPQAVKDLLM